MAWNRGLRYREKVDRLVKSKNLSPPINQHFLHGETMRKPPIILLLAIALTAGAPQAADAEGYGYGAYAYDEAGGIWGAEGFAVGKPSQAEADQAALEMCRTAGGSRCGLDGVITKRCFAKAGREGDSAREYEFAAVGFAENDTLEATEAQALALCRRQADEFDKAISIAFPGRLGRHGTCQVRLSGCAGDTKHEGGAQQAQQADESGAFGAFAIDESAWAFAFSVLYPSQAEADQQASSLCAEEGGEHCEIKYQFTDSRCGAAAVAEEQGLRAWGFGHADARRGAIDNAMSYCKRENTSGGRCRKVAVSCGELGAPQAADADDGQRYGAFAIDESAWAFAFSVWYPSQAEADQQAVSLCAQEGGEHCEIKYQFTNRCAAVAVAEEQGLRAWGFGEADGEAGAIDAAMSYCKRENASGGACHIEAASCGGDLADDITEETQAADADSAFGAFAIDESAWAFAFSVWYPSQAEADQQAVSLCAQEGGEHCEIKYQFTNRCAAVAVAEEQGLRAWGFGEADGEAGAIDAAMSYCKRENASGGACLIEAASCGERR